ncbi:MAG: flavin reductase [Rhodothermales bacterium]|nr:flavin reductase [Rhodothermales bacterium]
MEIVQRSEETVDLRLDHPIWDRVFTVAPLVVVGTRDAAGNYDLEPKHLALPLGSGPYFGFVSTERHSTYRNIKRDRFFTVSFPNPSSVVVTSLISSPRREGRKKPALKALPMTRASTIDAMFVADSYLFLECELDRIVSGFGENCLISGIIRRAAVNKESLRLFELDDQVMLERRPILAFLPPERYAVLKSTRPFPFPDGTRH